MTYEKAYETSKLDTERLCPGRTIEQARGGPLFWDKTTQMEVDELNKIVHVYGEECEAIKEFIKTIPGTASQAKEHAEEFLHKQTESGKSWNTKRLAWIDILEREQAQQES